jgi:hypothetical protein
MKDGTAAWEMFCPGREQVFRSSTSIARIVAPAWNFTIATKITLTPVHLKAFGRKTMRVEGSWRDIGRGCGAWDEK